MKKRFLVCLLVAIMVFSAVGCGANSAGAEKPKDSSELKVAILLPSPPTYGGFGQLGAEALKKAATEYGFEPVIVEASTADLMKSEATSLAEEGFNIIFGHGGQYAEPFSEISGDYPDTYFITTGGNVITENQLPVEYTAEQLAYVQGVIAAKLTKTNKMGLVIGGDFPAYKKASRGFELGAKSVNPNAEILLAITQDATDMNEAYEITKSQISQGADIVWANANQASLGSITAAKEDGVLIFGTIQDVSKEAPDLVVASFTMDMSNFVSETIKRYLDGTLEAKPIKLGIKEGAISWVWNEKVKATLPEDVVRLYDETANKILSGEIKVPGENEGW